MYLNVKDLTQSITHKNYWWAESHKSGKKTTKKLSWLKVLKDLLADNQFKIEVNRYRKKIILDRKKITSIIGEAQNLK